MKDNVKIVSTLLYRKKITITYGCGLYLQAGSHLFEYTS